MRDAGIALDPEGEIVGIPQHHPYAWVDRSLQAIHPALRLAFDRRFRLWVAVREDKETIRCDAVPGMCLSYLRPHVTVIHFCADRVIVDGRPVKRYKEPDDTFLTEVRQLESERLERDQSKWVTNKLKEVGEKREAEWDRKNRELAQAVTDEFVSVGGDVGRVQVGYGSG